MNNVIYNRKTLGDLELDELPEGSFRVTRNASWAAIPWTVSNSGGLIARFRIQKDAIEWARSRRT